MNAPTVILLIFLGSPLVLSETVDVQAAIQEVLKDVLGLHPPHGRSTRTVTPPKHMLALYHKYISGKGKRSTIPSTVRNILPIKGPPSMADLVLFNVSCVDKEEDVRLGQLHLNRRRLHQRHFSRRLLAPPYRVKVYRVTGNRLSSLGSIPIPQANKAAWHAVDITSPLKELLLKTRNSHMLGIRFEAPRGKPLTPKHFLRDTAGSSPSFLVIFSEESSENDVNKNGGIKKKGHSVKSHDIAMKIQSITKGKWIDENNDLNSIFPEISVSDNSEIEKTLINNSVGHLVSVKLSGEVETRKPPYHEYRKKRSVEDNELPELETNNSNSILAKEHVIPLPDHKKKGRRSDSNSNGKKKIMKNRSGISSAELRSTTQVSESPSLYRACRLQKFKINFSDIGWEWIIAPETFEANYCIGSCSFPLNKDVRATNHASLQSYIHYLGKNVPPPSCASDELVSAAFLYADDSGNVILKKYPDITVASCSCR